MNPIVVLVAPVASVILSLIFFSQRKKDKAKIYEQNKLLEKKNEELRKQADDLALLYRQIQILNKNLNLEIDQRVDILKAENSALVSGVYDFSMKLKSPIERIRSTTLLMKLETMNDQLKLLVENINNAVNEMEDVLNNLTQKFSR